MCEGLRYLDLAHKEWKVYFSNPKAYIPVLRDMGVIEWVKWGRREEETSPELVDFIQGGWASNDSLEQGQWGKFEPELVNLAVQGYMEKDKDGNLHWFDVPEGNAIQAVIVKRHLEERLYIVTTDSPPECSWVHDRWPSMTSIDQVAQG
ncbi:hypothetical protein LG200_01920 [Methylobacillus caricis]|uniref:hypothetical protein n=1 Tax=Methylobacillus caricis TaxID=1971611 RepID=UPI001CFF9D12|nr:hypothetical protein [Methylobacillus caricis]MCB5186758.1 hypothetical protein [Methylobacillus caricis]